MAKDVVTKPNDDLPDYLRGKEKTARVGNIDRSDLIIPRVKLIQAISPELTEFDNAKAGQFWHTIASETMGTEILGVPIIVRKTYALWAPRNDSRGILARASDGLHWDTPGLEFTVKPKGSPHPVTYKLGKTVHDSIDGQKALSEFGSSIPGDDNSPPAAALTYSFLWIFPDFMELSPAVIINTRSAVKPAKDLINKINMRPVDHYYQMYKISVVQENSEDGPFYNYKYTSHGYAPEDVGNKAKELFEFYNQAEWGANDESDDADKGNVAGDSGPSTSKKF